MDRTLIAMHTSGALLRSKLDEFKKVISPVAKVLIPQLLEIGLQVSVSTLSDDLYADLLQIQEGKNSGEDQKTKYVAGVELVEILLDECLKDYKKKSDAEKKKLRDQVHIVTLNPDLYASGEKEMKEYYFKKLTDSDKKDGEKKYLGLTQPKDGEKGTILAEAFKFPPAPYKNQHLAILRAKLGLAYKDMVLVDDKYENVNDALKLGSHIVYVTGKDALQAIHLEEISSPFEKEPGEGDPAP